MVTFFKKNNINIQIHLFYSGVIWDYFISSTIFDIWYYHSIVDILSFVLSVRI